MYEYELPEMVGGVCECELPEMVGGVCVEGREKEREMSGACWCERVRLQYVCLAYEVRVCVPECESGRCVFSVCETRGEGRSYHVRDQGACSVTKKTTGPHWHHLGHVPKWAVNTQPNCGFSLPEMEFNWAVRNFLDGTNEVVCQPVLSIPKGR